uniref:ShKT domain-containing protein n=1 Tax=Parastrongyloides trichosuri TaxID=131310 RepID=A0A0N4Z376_PARTI
MIKNLNLNLYYSTFVTIDEQPEITFLSEVEGSECSSCPEVPAHLVPRQACATIKKPKDDIVHISCQPLPELCIIEFRNRYSEFFQRVEKNFEKHLILKNADSQNKSQLTSSQTKDILKKILFSTTATPHITTKLSTLINSKMINANDRFKLLSSKNPNKEHLMKTDLKQKEIILKELKNDTIISLKHNLESEKSKLSLHQEFITSPSIIKQFDEESPIENNLPLIGIKETPTNSTKSLQSNAFVFRKNKRISNNANITLNKNELLFSKDQKITNIISKNSIINNTISDKDDDIICEDKSKICCFWALTGECNLNPFWMRTNCPKACGTCGCKLKEADKCLSTGIKCELPKKTILTSTLTIPTTLTTTSTIKPTTKKINKNDKNTFTDNKKSNLKSNKDDNVISKNFPGNTFSSNKNLKHIINAGITFPDKTTKTTTVKITTSVPSTISTTPFNDLTTTSRQRNILTTTEKPCKDHHKNCKFWSLLGECTKNPFWMKTQCEKSCNTCGTELDKVFAPTPHPGCNNHHKLCQFWAFNGQCESNPNWMLVKCKLSCRVC